MRARLAGSPPQLARCTRRRASCCRAGCAALRARLAALRGRPIVINKWASWCVPCRAEFGAFQRASLALGHEVAFIGIDSGDAGRRRGRVVPALLPGELPELLRPSGSAGSAITDSSFTPVTVFYDRRGGQYIRQGPYPSRCAKLERDVRALRAEAALTARCPSCASTR